LIVVMSDSTIAEIATQIADRRIVRERSQQIRDHALDEPS